MTYWISLSDIEASPEQAKLYNEYMWRIGSLDMRKEHMILAFARKSKLHAPRYPGDRSKDLHASTTWEISTEPPDM